MKHTLFRPVAIGCGVAAILVLAPAWFSFDGTPDREAFTSSGFGMSGVVPGQDYSPAGSTGVLMVLVYLVAAIALLTIPPDDKAAQVMAGAGVVATGIVLAGQFPLTAGYSVTWAAFLALAVWLVAFIVCRTAHNRTKTPRRP